MSRLSWRFGMRGLCRGGELVHLEGGAHVASPSIAPSAVIMSETISFPFGGKWHSGTN